MAITTTALHTYPDILHSGGRLAATVWETRDAKQAAAATLTRDAESIVLRIADWQGRYVAIGYAPGGIA